MNDNPGAPLITWLVDPMDRDVAKSIERLRKTDDVRRVAVMPDVHLSHDVCIGVAVATTHLLYPRAVGSDIGCGMAAVALDADASLLDNERAAARVLQQLYALVPANKHRNAAELPSSLNPHSISCPRLAKLAVRDGRLQLGTLGRGNHFLEFQRDATGRLWAMVHSGSRGMGQAISDHHLRNALPTASGLLALDSGMESGLAYLNDLAWAARYACENRLAMLRAVDQILVEEFAIRTSWDGLIQSDHNHLRQERHDDTVLWLHRKGAQRAGEGEPGIVPGSMGASSFHVVGRGCDLALMSCSHGAGRQLRRTEARKLFGRREFERQVGSLWFDHRRIDQLRDEAPAAYKDIRRVMGAQRDLVRVERELQPVLSYKGN
jgi:tRNA-splicing ligase RtcB